MFITYLLLASVGLISVGYYFYSPPQAYLRQRTPDMDRQRQLYPPEVLPIVMRALEAIRDAFLLRRMDIYRLQPQDRLHALYHAAYRYGGPDA